MFLVLFSLILAATAERVADDWVDPFDMLNYESSTRGRESLEVRINGWLMNLPVRSRFVSPCGENLSLSSTALQASEYSNVPTKRREYCSQEFILTERSQHSREIAELQRQVGNLAWCAPAIRAGLGKPPDWLVGHRCVLRYDRSTRAGENGRTCALISFKNEQKRSNIFEASWYLEMTLKTYLKNDEINIFWLTIMITSSLSTLKKLLMASNGPRAVVCRSLFSIFLVYSCYL